MANKGVELRFKAMERSLRATGCTLPLWVIPYNDEKFDLPENSTWWEAPEIVGWLNLHGCRGVYRKYQCLLTDNYQFVDSDVIILRDPSEVLQDLSGFITSCRHWSATGGTCTTESLKYLSDKTTLWATKVFNSGQFACDKALYSLDTLKEIAEDPIFKYTSLVFPFHEQPGINMLVNATDVPIHNLTLPPYNMESTWAGDYLTEKYATYWKDENRKPYLIHWAGCRMDTKRPIDELFINYLTSNEKKQWSEQLAMQNAKRTTYKKVRIYLSRLKQAVTSVNFE